MRQVSVIGWARLPVKKRYSRTIRQLGANVTQAALGNASLERPDALYLSNMLADELQSQKHLAALVADEAGLAGVEAIAVRATSASGAAALRVGMMAVASGMVETAVVVGVEKMSDQVPTPILAKALDAEREVPDGATMVGQNAVAMQLYLARFHVAAADFACFAVNAHQNARNNPDAIFSDKTVTAEMVLGSRLIVPPIRLYDCSPICDGAAAVVLCATEHAHRYRATAVPILAATTATDHFRLLDRPDPLVLQAVAQSTGSALQQAGIERQAVDFFELHDAFSIMTCLQLEAAGFAPAGSGWRLAVAGEIGLNGRIPIATMGGLKARGHPIGATALYQVSEIVQQLTGQAGANQLPDPQVAMLQSIGGMATTVFTFLLGN